MSKTRAIVGKRLRDGLERLDITAEQVEAVPRISHILMKLSQETNWVEHLIDSKLNPGTKIRCDGCRECTEGYIKIVENADWMDKVIEYLRGSDAKEARVILDKYSSVPISNRKLLPFEAYCVAANITTKRAWEVIQGAIFEQASMESSALAAASHPSIVRTTIDLAKLPSGSKERQMLHLHSGFVPTPKNSVTFIKQVNQDNRDQSQNVTLAPIDDTVKRISDRFNELQAGRMKELPAGPTVDVEAEEDDAES